MYDPASRLIEARASRYPSARQAAIALGISPDTYSQYENGTRGFAKHADRFARFFRVNLEWLLTGKGPIRSQSSGLSIPIRGYVGAGGAIETRDMSELAQLGDTLSLPDLDSVSALQVKGDSQWPRFVDGEYVLYYSTPLPPEELINCYAVVETEDGRSMIKTIRRGRAERTYRLESHNAPPEDGVRIDCAYEYAGTLPAARRQNNRRRVK